MFSKSQLIGAITVMVVSVFTLVTATILPVSAIAYPPDMIPVHRFYNKITGTHFYTAVQSEASYVNDKLFNTYSYEGVGFYAYPQDDGTRTAVYRFYNLHNGVHFYTSSSHEAQTVRSTMSSTYRDEGVGYYSHPTNQVNGNGGIVNVYRFYNFTKGTHFYTAVQSEASHVNDKLFNTYRFEGVSYGAVGSFYANCTEARASGAAPMYVNEIGYRIELDRDRDNIACEVE